MAGELELEDERTAKKRVRRGCVHLGVDDSFGQTENDELTDDQVELLVCPLCGSFARPHVLWFDECYDEENYGFVFAQGAVANASLCIRRRPLPRGR
jgi:NAD-dependent SIR2 family protein deacetylase